MDVRLVFCTCPDSESAQSLATALVTRRLAACVNLLPAIQSVYRWEGRVEQASELQLLIKTTTDRIDAVTALIQQEHPYDLPEILAIAPSAGLPAYLDWIRAETREDT